MNAQPRIASSAEMADHMRAAMRGVAPADPKLPRLELPCELQLMSPAGDTITAHVTHEGLSLLVKTTDGRLMAADSNWARLKALGLLDDDAADPVTA